ncbi:MAG: hypothetical protein ABEJ81_07270 [Haloferacaceae archaeon]
MAGYYDFVLALIPVSLIGTTGLLLGVGLETTTAVPIAAGAAVILIGHALFVNAPVAPSPSVGGASGAADADPGAGGSTGPISAD